MELSDIIVKPNLEKFNHLEIAGQEEMIEEGYRATKDAIPIIKDLFMVKFKVKK